MADHEESIDCKSIVLWPFHFQRWCILCPIDSAINQRCTWYRAEAKIYSYLLFIVFYGRLGGGCLQPKLILLIYIWLLRSWDLSISSILFSSLLPRRVVVSIMIGVTLPFLLNIVIVWTLLFVRTDDFVPCILALKLLNNLYLFFVYL